MAPRPWDGHAAYADTGQRMRQWLRGPRKITLPLLVGVAALHILLVFPGTAHAHTPDWVSRLLEWLFGKKAAVGEAPSAGWMNPAVAPDFRLVNQNGQAVSSQDLRGKVVLMNFMYTGCEDLCSSMKELKILANALGGTMGREVIFISIALDPERDTPQVLRVFSQEWGAVGWTFLTGPPEAIEMLTQAYGVYVMRVPASHTSSHQGIEYSDVILFLDREGRLRKRVLPHLLRLSGRQDVEWLLDGHHH